MQLRQLQPGLLQATLFALIVVLLVNLSPLAIVACVLVYAICIALTRAFRANDEEAAQITIIIAAFTAVTAAMAGGGLAGIVFAWPAEAVLATGALSATAALAYALYHWKHVMIFVPKGQSIIIRGLLGTREIRGPTRAMPPLPVIEWAVAVVPTSPLEVEQIIHEVETSRPNDRVSLTVVDATYIPGSESYSLTQRIHQLRINVRYWLAAEEWYLLMEIPNLNQRASRLLAQLPPSQLPWRRRPEAWERIVADFVNEELERGARRVVHRSNLSPQEVGRQRERLAAILTEQLRNDVGRHAIEISEVELVEVDVDPVETIRMAREAELIARGETARLTHVGATLGQMELGLVQQIGRVFIDAGIPVDAGDIELIVRHYLRALSGRPGPAEQVEDLLDTLLGRRSLVGAGKVSQRGAA